MLRLSLLEMQPCRAMAAAHPGQGPGMPECLAQVELPSSLQWVQELQFDAWAFDREEGSFEVQAACAEGYLLMFVVDD